MLQDLQTISLAIAFIFPFVWGITFFVSGFKNERSKVFLFFLMLEASFAYMMTFFKFEGYIEIYSTLFPFQAGTVFTLFPLMYWYVKSLTSEKEINKWRAFLHFIPSFFVLVTISILQKGVIGTGVEIEFVKFLLDKDVAVGDNFVIGKTIYEIFKKIFVLVSMIYIIAVVLLVRKHYIKIKELFSENDKIGLRWIKGLGIIFSLMVIFFVLIHILGNEQVESHQGIVVVSYLTFGVFFWYLGLSGFRQKEVYDITEVEESDEFKPDLRISKIEMESYLTTSKVYRKHDVSVFDLCYHFHTNRTYLSEAIKNNFDTNFRGLINKYRIEEAKEIIQSNISNDIDSDLENVANRSGFSSYSTFFRVFRSELGITPSEYIKTTKK